MDQLVTTSPALAAPVRKLRPPATPAEIADWLKRFAESGLGQREFSRRHGLALMTLHRWVKRAQRNGASGLQAAEPLVEPKVAAPSFAEIKLAVPVGVPDSRQRWAVEVCRPGGNLLRLAHDVPPALLEQLLRLC